MINTTQVDIPERVTSSGGRYHWKGDDWQFYDTQNASFEFEGGKMITWEDAINSDLVISPVEKFTGYDDVPPVLPNDDGSYEIPMPGKTQVL